MSAPKLLTAFAAMALLAACSSEPETAVAGGAGGAGAGAIRPGSQEDLRANVGDRVLFQTDSSVVAAGERPVLERQARWMAQHSAVQVTVEGHADERGTREYNLALGARRAQAVKDFLVSRGVAASRISTVSFGKERPIDPRSNEEGWAMNRNAHTTLTGGAVS